MQSSSIPSWAQFPHSDMYMGADFYQNPNGLPAPGIDYQSAIQGISPSTFIGSSRPSFSTNPVNLAGSRQRINYDTFPKTRYPITSAVYPSYPNYSDSPRYERTSYTPRQYKMGNTERYANTFNNGIYSNNSNVPISILTTGDPNQAFVNGGGGYDLTAKQGDYAFIASIANTNRPFIAARGGYEGQDVQIPNINNASDCGFEKVSGLYNC